MLSRIVTLIIKELQMLLMDRSSRMVLIMPVVLQLGLFPFAATLEVTNNTLAVFNEDNGNQSLELIKRFSKAQAFSEFIPLYSELDIHQVLDNQKALIVIRFPADFSRNIAAGHSATIQALLDGRRSNSGQIALGYVQQILLNYNNERLIDQRRSPPSLLMTRNWFNPNLTYVRHIVPGLVAIITTISTLIITALSVAREREQGTFDQLLVSPLTPGMIMIGKAIPAMLVAMTQATIILLAGIFIYQVPVGIITQTLEEVIFKADCADPVWFTWKLNIDSVFLKAEYSEELFLQMAKVFRNGEATSLKLYCLVWVQELELN